VISENFIENKDIEEDIEIIIPKKKKGC